MSLHKVCPMWASVFVVPQTHGPEDYMVKFIPGSQPVCTCPAYRYSGGYDEQTCKHIRQVRAHGCFYYEPYKQELMSNVDVCGRRDFEDVGIHLFSTTIKNRLEVLCLGCGLPMIGVYT
jgi:hypothetical protein